jgi:hypothetical protein
MLEIVRSRSFLESDLWNGKKIAKELDLGILGAETFEERKSNPFLKAWPYVQMHILSELFEERRREVFELYPRKFKSWHFGSSESSRS